MSSERDVQRIVKSWLEEGPVVIPDRVIDAVAADLPATRQRHARWLARRFPIMNNKVFSFGVAAAALIAIVFFGARFLIGPNTGGPQATPTPTAFATSTTPPSLAAADFPLAGSIPSGVRIPMIREGIPLTIEVPTSDWISNGEFQLKKSTPGSGGAAFIFWIGTPDGIYEDPCAQVQGPVAGTSATELAAAVASVPDTEVVSGPSDVTVGGHPAQLVVLRVPVDAPCGAGPSGFSLWYDEEIGGRYATALGMTVSVWIVDVDGTLVWIDGEALKGAPADVGREMQQIVDSIQFE